MSDISAATAHYNDFMYYQPVLVSQETCEHAMERLNVIINNHKGWKNTVKEIFDAFNQTIGITCDNYLPWSTDYQKGDYFSFNEKSLDAPAKWGIGSASRPFIAFKYEIGEAECDSSGKSRGVSTLFQRYSPKSDSMVYVHGHHHAAGGAPYALDYNAFKGTMEEYLATIKEFFKGNTVVNPLQNRITEIKLAKD